VLRQLSELGAYTIDADQRVHDILMRGAEGYGPVLEAFGESILGEDAEIDRRALGRIVFADPTALRKLELITHPIVRKVLEREIAASSARVVVLDAIKLIESGWADKCDQVWVVTCEPQQQLERLMRTRGYSRDEAQMRIESQPPQADKIARGDVVIDNSGSKQNTRRQVREAWERCGLGDRD
jgi:dephospho-CoA kinase